MWSDKLKINKQLSEAMIDLGFSSPKEIQEKAMTRIMGGQDIVAIGPEGCGKTSSYILGIVMKLKYAFEEAPRALVLVPDKERGHAVIEQFSQLAKNTNLRVLGAFAGAGIEPQMDTLADGVDVVIGTPDRVRELYLKLGLNTNKITMFILDDAHLLIKQGFQLQITELSRSLRQCQHLVFSELLHEKLEKIINPFLHYPHYIEIIEEIEVKVPIYDQLLYHVPNFKTKLNLLNLLLVDAGKYTKVVVFVNTKITADRVLQRLRQSMGEEVALYNTTNFHREGIESIEEFKGTKGIRALLVANEEIMPAELNGIPYVINLELPEEIEASVKRIAKNDEIINPPFFLNFVTDIDLINVKRIERQTGNQMQVLELPRGLKIESESKKAAEDAEEKTKAKSELPTTGAAFHEKKESNAKQYNYGYKDKMKMAGKISKRRNK